jgi:hypothetical protein
MSSGDRRVEKLWHEGKWRKDGGFLLSGTMAYIGDDDDRRVGPGQVGSSTGGELVGRVWSDTLGGPQSLRWVVDRWGPRSV